MDEEDAEKTAFITPWGMYCYKMMSFGLKNAGATYMRAMTTIFHDIIHKKIEVYVDEVIIKSRRSTDHIADLRKFFNRLRRMLKKDATTYWTEEGHKAFDKIKEYLSKPPKEVKGQALADHLAENHVDGEYEALKTYFLDEEVPFVEKTSLKHTMIHADMIRVQPNKLNATNAPWPFSAWGMYVIGSVEPAVSNGHKFILVAIDYFTKWVEATSYKAVTRLVLESIITGKDANLNSDLIKAMCETFKIKHKNSTGYKPQINGAIEAANKNIKNILRKMVHNYKQWHEKLPFSLLGYRTTIHTSTGATSYLLVYGTKLVILAEVETPSLRIIQEVELSNAEWAQSRYEQLALIDGKRMNALCHGQLYQNRMARDFNKKVRPRQFTPGQLVLKRIFLHQDKAKGKFSLSWQGPYMVHRVLIGGAFILVEMDGEIWKKPINSDAVKRYYI
ncbi:uncharacterized protein [Nicotiana sylvestris]|uniref:uncharacterized protein n=1 Tax=Nicotiana sylvestris TaxID=4096 RepID=UPI00388CBF2D